jgi:uncharacterized membrane protein YbhN (UPF0104 family)
MYAQSASVAGAGTGAFATIGYSHLAWILAAITLFFALMSVRQLVRRGGSARP